jgi:AraC-like DNA-binding protein
MQITADTGLTRFINEAHEDLNRVYNLVHDGGYAVVLCDSEGEPLYLHDPRNSGKHQPALLAKNWQSAISRNGASISATAIFEEDDSPVAFLGIVPAVPSMSEPPRSIIGAVLRASARAIEERLFRARHSSAWIVAAVHDAENRSDMLLAVDLNERVVGADRAARLLLAAEEHDVASAPDLWTVFERNQSFNTLPLANDLACTLVCRRTAEKWWTLITPPALAQQCNKLDITLAHTRPRIDAVGPAYEAVPSKHSRGGLAPSVMRRIRKYIDVCIASGVDVEFLASMAGLSASYFSRAFKQTVGMPPHAYIIHRRLQKAGGLLTDTGLSLAEIALACGFADQSHFTRVFSRKFRTSPGAWRRARELSIPKESVARGMPRQECSSRYRHDRYRADRSAPRTIA